MGSPVTNRRADAQRSRARILDAAVRLLNADPDTTIEVIATTAGVTRQTVYAHFPARQQLLAAVIDRVTEEAVAAMDAADLDAGPAADALLRLLDAGAATSQRYHRVMSTSGSLPVSPEADRERHAPVADRLKHVIQRGQRAGEFDDGRSADWLVAVVISLGHAAAEQVESGRMSSAQAREELHATLLRILAATTPLPVSGRPGSTPR
jgi:AcrR family transcriptional regulator